jgi:hypothetical protein
MGSAMLPGVVPVAQLVGPQPIGIRTSTVGIAHDLIQLALNPRAQSAQPLQLNQHLARDLKQKRNMLWFCR